MVGQVSRRVNSWWCRRKGKSRGRTDRQDRQLQTRTFNTPASEGYKIQAHTDMAAGKKRTTSSALFLEKKEMEVEHVLATNSMVASANSFWNKK